MRIQIIVLLCGVLFACGSKFSNKTPDIQLVDKNATAETRAMFYSLKNMMGNKILFGHQDALAYGIGWKNEDLRSDVHDVCGKFPAVYGWDLGHIGDTMNIDSVSFERMRFWIQSAFERGAINTISMHLHNPATGGSSWDTAEAVKYILPGAPKNLQYKQTLNLIADFLNNLKSRKGVSVPIILRIYHEHNGNWFWWGAKSCTPDEYKALYRFTVEYLRDSCNVHNVLYAYSPDKFNGPDEYLERYPGNEYVDVMGVDNYWHFKSIETSDIAVRQVRQVVELALKNNKIAALTETGLESIPDAEWFTKVLLEPIKSDSVARKIAWLLVWRNYDKKHHYAPYPGHKAVNDFIRFENDPLTAFEEDLPDMYTMPR